QQPSWPAPRFGSPPTASPTSTASSLTTGPATGPVTSRGSSARTRGTRRPSPTRPATTGRSSATSAFLPRSFSTPTSSPAKTPALPRSRSGTFTTTAPGHTAAQAGGHQLLESKTASPTFSPHTPSDRAVAVYADSSERQQRQAQAAGTGSRRVSSRSQRTASPPASRRRAWRAQAQ